MIYRWKVRFNFTLPLILPDGESTPVSLSMYLFIFSSANPNICILERPSPSQVYKDKFSLFCYPESFISLGLDVYLFPPLDIRLLSAVAWNANGTDTCKGGVPTLKPRIDGFPASVSCISSATALSFAIVRLGWSCRLGQRKRAEVMVCLSQAAIWPSDLALSQHILDQPVGAPETM